MHSKSLIDTQFNRNKNIFMKTIAVGNTIEMSIVVVMIMLVMMIYHDKMIHAIQRNSESCLERPEVRVVASDRWPWI